MLLFSKKFFFLTIIIYYFLNEFDKEIYKPWRNVFYNEYEEDDAGIQEIEFMYVDNYHRLPEERRQLIEDKIFDLRRYPTKDKKLAVKSFVENVVALPTEEELNMKLPVPENVDFSEFAQYGEEVQMEVKRLYYRFYNAISTYPTYLLSLPGWGKTYLVDLLVAKLGIKKMTLKLERGCSVNDLIGRPPSGDDPGSIGLLGEALIQAGKGPTLLFADEVDKGINGKNGGEIAEFILKNFNGTVSSIKSPYLYGEHLYMPVVAIFGGNEPLTISAYDSSQNALRNRLNVIKLKRYTWEQKMKIMENMLPYLIEKKLHIPPIILTEKQKKGWLKELEFYRKEQEALPENERNESVRPLVKLSIVYLVKMKYKKDIEAVRAKMNL